MSHLYLAKFAPRDNQSSLDRRSSSRHFPVQEMIGRLKLDPDQEKRLLSILERRREDMRQAAEEAKEAVSAIKKRVRAEILEILTDDQAREFDEFIREIRSRRRQRESEPPGTSPGRKERR